MKKLTWIFLIVITAALTYKFLPQKEIAHSPGILIKEDPYQKNILNGKPWQKGKYKITPLAVFKLKAEVLSKENYHYDRESELSPFDLALGWGPMSDQANLDRIDISQRNRWYFWKTDNYPISRKQIETKSSNMHIIPSNKLIEDEIDDLVKGNVIELSGYLVFVESMYDDWKWKSSLTRNDVGGGACELFWVDEFSILK